MQITIYLVLSANGQAEPYLCVNCTLLTFVCESTFFRTIQVVVLKVLAYAIGLILAGYGTTAAAQTLIIL